MQGLNSIEQAYNDPVQPYLQTCHVSEKQAHQTSLSKLSYREHDEQVQQPKSKKKTNQNFFQCKNWTYTRKNAQSNSCLSRIHSDIKFLLHHLNSLLTQSPNLCCIISIMTIIRRCFRICNYSFFLSSKFTVRGFMLIKGNIL